MAEKRKNPYAVALGRKGGKRGGPARAAKMTPEERSRSARNAVMARWAKEKASESFGVEPAANRKRMFGPSAALVPIESRATRPGIESEFHKLVREWKEVRSASSLTSVICMHPAYQRIIGLGTPAVPLILAELNREIDYWFWALKAITGQDPVHPQSQGKLREMAEQWIEWGRKHGYAENLVTPRIPNSSSSQPPKN